MADLRERREALGLELSAMAAELHIPVQHLAAIEDGRLDELPVGPYGPGWVRAYCAHLGEDPDALLEELALHAPVPRAALPLNAIRALAVFTCVLLASLIVVQVWPSPPPAEVDPSTQVEEPPDQHVQVTVHRGGALKILVDGREVLDRAVRPGEKIEVSGHDRVEVHLPSVEMARVVYNGERITPLGRQDAPRRLVFVDDLAVGD